MDTYTYTNSSYNINYTSWGGTDYQKFPNTTAATNTTVYPIFSEYLEYLKQYGGLNTPPVERFVDKQYNIIEKGKLE